MRTREKSPLAPSAAVAARCSTPAPRASAALRLDGPAKERYGARSRVIKALAHPTRLFIVDRLAEREHCVCELAQMAGADVSTVSKHLSVLANAGVAKQDKRGSQVWYSLRVPCILNFFGCVEAVIGS
jgi:DNA-binding transcriptional ArsR family regulator